MTDESIIILIVYLFYSIWITFKIIKTAYLNQTQKITHVIFTWLIPILWGLFVLYLIKPSSLKTITKDKRKTKKWRNTDNWRSITGHR